MPEMMMEPDAGAGGRPNGLLARASGQMRQQGSAQQGSAQQGGAMSSANDTEPAPNVSPEEQQQYDQFVKNAFRLIYDVNPKTGKGTVRQGVLESLKGPGDPKEGLAATAASVTKRVVDSAAEAGRAIDGAIIMHAGKEILEDLADLQEQAGIANLSKEDIEGAFYRAADIYREAAAADGSLDTGVFAQDFKAMQDADAAGKLDEVVPGATQAAERMKTIMGKGAA